MIPEEIILDKNESVPDFKFDLVSENEPEFGKPNIMVIGCGGGGSNSVTRLYGMGIKGAEIIAVNTDWQALVELTEADKKILIGKTITRGRGAGGDPSLAKRCVDASRRVFEELLHDANLVFITAGLGGGTGTGSAPAIAKIAKDNGAIVVAIVTTPFELERERIYKAEDGLEELRVYADCVIAIDNNRLLPLVGNKSVEHAFTMIDELIAEIIRGVTETITVPSLINLDFADLKSIIRDGGSATILYGESSLNDIDGVVEVALNNPLFDINCKGARGALVHITSGRNLSLKNAEEIANGITKALAPDADVILGARLDPDLNDKVRVMSIITSFSNDRKRKGRSNRNSRYGRRSSRYYGMGNVTGWDKWDIPLVG
jgi:cell division protein FtsZ